MTKDAIKPPVDESQPVLPKITADDVMSWFRDANQTPQRKLQRGLPGQHQLTRLTKLINDQRLWNATREGGRLRGATPRANQEDVELEHWREAQRCLKGLLEVVPKLIRALESFDPRREDPLTDFLANQLLPAAEGAVAVLGEPRRPGRHGELWLTCATSLLPLIRAAWQDAGRTQLSLKADGPVVKVMCAALEAIFSLDQAPRR